MAHTDNPFATRVKTSFLLITTVTTDYNTLEL